MYQMVNPFQPNASQLQMYGPQSINTEQFIQPHSFPLISPNVAPAQMPAGNSLPPMCLPNSMMPPQISMPPMCLPNSMMPSPVISSSQFVSYNQGKVIPSDPYCCNFLVQLEGSYETDGAQIQVELVGADRQYAQVRRQETAGESVVDQLIYEDETRFTLCLLNGYVLAVMLKGSNMKDSVTWYTNECSQIVWRRIGDVTFSLVTITPEQSRRNSLASNFSGVSQMSHSDFRSKDDVRMRIRPELRSQADVNNTGSSPTPADTTETADSTNSSGSPISQGTSPTDQRLSDDELFDQFKDYCASCPSLRQKIIQWGISRTPNRRVGAREISELAAGRIWIKAKLVQTKNGNTEKWQEILDEVKGAYQEVEEGLFLQPPSQLNEPGVQHRLRKNDLGFWIIEEPNELHDVWYPCLQELPFGGWVDLKDSRRRYHIQILTMESILYSMRDQWADLGEMEKSMEFLYNSCNQKKLNTKLKARNLKHNISNLTLKLEKQYNLSFAVRIAETADAMALEGEDLYVQLE